MTNNWIFINSGKQDAAYNMALDEALLEWHAEGLIPPVIRFYQWEPAALSIGYFQRVERDIHLPAVKEMGLGFVRRPTGGRAVLHEHELTYSVIVSEDYPDMPKTVTEAYRVISEGILQGFRNLGLQAEFSVPKSESQREALSQPKSAVCFDAPSWYELVVEGKKVAGSAQTRQKGVILQHGAILIDLDEDKYLNCFSYESEEKRQKVKERLSQKAVSINKIVSKTIEVDQCIPAFKNGFESALNIHLTSFSLTPEQQQYVENLADTRYRSDEWNFRK
ncbi:octanoyltransferase [Chryseomicrobium excrementi]|uniref:Octanoyltransferase LipM n=1 Tax=Chryseomicrobium excrementi TaxID=2041346 RepID=A0A2M9F2A7_9BACL|nr:biotin/lipoate A/B protein ligase family protein [Chryseomicrobium excrementi]PJK17599.1 octanoyltransferase [Chryseomicrobium excrementi]